MQFEDDLRHLCAEFYFELKKTNEDLHPRNGFTWVDIISTIYDNFSYLALNFTRTDQICYLDLNFIGARLAW
jgi:hypothetical protein